MSEIVGQKITGLTALSSVDPLDLVPLVDISAIVTKKTTVAELAAGMVSVLQPLNTSLTSLASLSVVNNVVPVGNGASSFTALSLSTNTLLGRSSTGNVAAKSCTDFGFSLIDDSTASEARTTLGVDASGTVPTAITVANEASDATCFLLFSTAATGNLGPKTNASLTFDSTTGRVTLAAPVLGTPTSVTLTNATGLPVGTGISGLGTGVATALAVNVGSAGAPVLFNGALGTPSSGVATNLTGTAAGLTAGTASAVALGGITGLGTGVATALAIAIGSAGAPLVFNGALGTPSSGTVTNLTGTASININGTVGGTTPAAVACTTLGASDTVTVTNATTALLNLTKTGANAGTANIYNGGVLTLAANPNLDLIFYRTSVHEFLSYDAGTRLATLTVTGLAIGTGALAGYKLDIATSAANGRGVNVSVTSTSGEVYGGVLRVTGAATTNTGLFLDVVNGGANYGIVIVNTPVAGNNHAIYSSAAAPSYIVGKMGFGIEPVSQVHVQSSGASVIGGIIQGAASRSVALLQLQTSAGDSLGNVGGRVANIIGGGSTSTDGTFDDIHTYTLPANCLARLGDSVSGTISLYTAGHATATRQIKLVFAGTTVIDTGAQVTATSGFLIINVIIIRVASDAVRIHAWVEQSIFPAVVATVLTSISGLTLTGTNVLKVTAAAAGVGAASGDINGWIAAIDRAEAA